MESIDANQPAIKHELGFLEVVERSGKVTQRVALTSLPVSIGRAYDNDVILSDTYVCPHHVRLEYNEAGEVIATDLGSVNGLFSTTSRERLAMASLSSGETLSLGHTRIRFRTRHHPVGPALSDHHTHMLIGAYENKIIQFLIIAISIFALWLGNFLEIVEKDEASKAFFQLIYPAAVVILWAGLWAFATRIVSQRFKFLVHTTIACFAVLAVVCFDTSLDYASFAFALDRYRTAFSVIGGAAIVAVLLYSHLRFCTLASPTRIASISCMISIAAIGLLLLNSHVQKGQFSPGPRFQTTLKAPPFQVVDGQTLPKFFTRVQAIRDQVDISAEK